MTFDKRTIEAATGGVLYKKLFLKTSQYSQESKFTFVSKENFIISKGLHCGNMLLFRKLGQFFLKENFSWNEAISLTSPLRRLQFQPMKLLHVDFHGTFSLGEN